MILSMDEPTATSLLAFTEAALPAMRGAEAAAFELARAAGRSMATADAVGFALGAPAVGSAPT